MCTANTLYNAVMALTKEGKIQKLKDLGVELTGNELVKDLDALLESFAPKNTTPAETPISEINDATGVKSQNQVDNEQVKRVVVRYINPELGLTDRVFSLEVHGENFRVLAQGFKDKFDGTFDP